MKQMTPQVERALHKANHQRCGAAWLRRHISTLTFEEGVEFVSWWLAEYAYVFPAMKLIDLLCALHRVHKVKAARFMNRMECPENKRVVALTDRQIAQIAANLNHVRMGSVMPWVVVPEQAVRKCG